MAIKLRLERSVYKITVNGRRLVRLASDVTKYVIVTFYFGHVINIVHRC